ncbi:MAG: hypothetical protein AAGG11_08230 [Pseudomonadota bacterium]
MSPRSAAVSTLAAGLLAIYPLLFVWGNEQLPRSVLVAVFGALVVLRMVTGQSLSSAALKVLVPLLTLFCLLVAFDPELRALRAYPVLLCLAGFVYCAYTLRVPPSAIERFMRRTGLVPTPFQARYMRGVTLLWLGFFGLNAIVTAYLGWAASLTVWAWHTGFVSYLVMGLLLIGEYLFRLWYRRREAEQSA